MCINGLSILTDACWSVEVRIKTTIRETENQLKKEKYSLKGTAYMERTIHPRTYWDKPSISFDVQVRNDCKRFESHWFLELI